MKTAAPDELEELSAVSTISQSSLRRRKDLDPFNGDPTVLNTMNRHSLRISNNKQRWQLSCRVDMGLLLFYQEETISCKPSDTQTYRKVMKCIGWNNLPIYVPIHSNWKHEVNPDYTLLPVFPHVPHVFLSSSISSRWHSFWIFFRLLPQKHLQHSLHALQSHSQARAR